MLLHLDEVEMQLRTVPPCQHILETINQSITKTSVSVFHARFSPAKKVLHVLEEDVGPVPGRQAPLPLGVAAHRAAGNQLINSMVGQGCTFQSEDYSSMCD